MNNVELKRCLNLAEVMYEAGGINMANVDVAVDRHAMSTYIVCHGAEVSIVIRPKGEDNEYIH